MVGLIVAVGCGGGPDEPSNAEDLEVSIRDCRVDGLSAPYATVEVTNVGSDRLDVDVELRFEGGAGTRPASSATGTVFDLGPGETNSLPIFGAEGSAQGSVLCTVVGATQRAATPLP